MTGQRGGEPLIRALGQLSSGQCVRGFSWGPWGYPPNRGHAKYKPRTKPVWLTLPGPGEAGAS